MRGTEFAQLNALAVVAKERNFRRAAKRLGLSPSALSRTIRAIEERLGARLLHRTTRSVAPTEAGTMLLARIAPAFAEIESAADAAAASGGHPSGRLRLTLPAIAAHMILAPLLGRFTAAYPEIHLELMMNDAFIDAVATGYDAGIRLGHSVQQDMVAVRLTPDIRPAVVGAPAYFARHAAPKKPHDLAQHACINYRWDATGALYRWPFHGPGGPFDVAVEGPLTMNDTIMMREAALQGCGLSSLPEAFVAAHLASGRLVRVLDDWCRPFPGFFLYYPGRRHTPPALRALLDFLKSEPQPSSSARKKRAVRGRTGAKSPRD